MAKQLFFDNKIQEIVLTNKKLWDLMNWVKKCKLPTIEAIKFNKNSCNELDKLWQTLYQSYNAVQNRLINLFNFWMKFHYINRLNSLYSPKQNLLKQSINVVVCLLQILIKSPRIISKH